MKLKQWYLNAGLIIVSLLVVVMAVSRLFGQTPISVLSWGGNLLVYLFFVIVFELGFPFVLGFLVRLYPVEILDTSFGSQDEHLPGGLEVVLACITGIATAAILVWLTPMMAHLPSLSQWPIYDFFRWIPGPVELMNWPVAVASFILGAAGFGVGYLQSKES